MCSQCCWHCIDSALGWRHSCTSYSRLELTDRYGIAVHFRIYPIVYALAILVFLKGDSWLNQRQLSFAITSGSVFFALLAAGYALYVYMQGALTPQLWPSIPVRNLPVPFCPHRSETQLFRLLLRLVSSQRLECWLFGLCSSSYRAHHTLLATRT